MGWGAIWLHTAQLLQQLETAFCKLRVRVIASFAKNEMRLQRAIDGLARRFWRGHTAAFKASVQFQTAYCSSLRTVCWLVLAWASTAVAACCMIPVRESSVEAIA